MKPPRADSWFGAIVTVQEVTCADCEIQEHFHGNERAAIRKFKALGWRKIEGKWRSPICCEEPTNATRARIHSVITATRSDDGNAALLALATIEDILKETS